MINMQELINELLENALTNGFDQSKSNPLDVAEDLVRFSSEVEMENPEDLVPYIEDWQKRKRNGSV